VVKEPKEQKKEKKFPVKETEPSRWSHDLYNEEEQTPKTKEELSRAYGYDIFTEDQSAGRIRRYGYEKNYGLSRS